MRRQYLHCSGNTLPGNGLEWLHSWIDGVTRLDHGGVLVSASLSEVAGSGDIRRVSAAWTAHINELTRRWRNIRGCFPEREEGMDECHW